MKTRRVHGGVRGALFALVFVTAGLTAAFYLTAFMYARLDWRPPALVVQLINSVLGTLLMVAAVVIPRLLFQRDHINPFDSIIGALKQISQGDFSARLEDKHPNGPVGELVQTVNDMALQLDQMEKMRQEFISDVSHEIQSPLTSIRGFAAALQQENVTAEDRRHYLDIIEAESTRLSKLSANLLKLASLEAKQVRFEPKLYRLDVQIRNLVLACEPQWSGKQIEMEVTLDECDVTADEDLLSQVWINLLNNAIKFTPPGGSVKVALRRRDTQLEVTFADSGIGISPADQPHIFDRFYKADRSRGRAEGGSGLGLSIAKKAIELHRGTITVKSESDSGATFRVELPS